MVWVYAHTGTHCASGTWMGAQGLGQDAWRARRLNLGMYVFVYVYKVHMCIYMLGGGMSSWNNCFFS